MQNTAFGLVPRGDNLFSFRFLETLSTGAIPVIFSDRWALPFSEILDYNTFAVRIAEDDWATTLDVLRAIPAEKVCQMRREALKVYHAHFATVHAQIDTLLAIVALRKGLELDI